MKRFNELREATMSTWTVTVQKPVNKLKKGDKQVVKARSGFEAINKAMKLWKDPALKAASADSFKITKESIDEGKMKRNPAIDNNPDVKAARKAHADGTWDGNVDKEGEAIVHIKGKPYTVTNNNESVKEGKMKELQDYIDQGKSAEWIAKKIGYPVKDVKDFLKGYQKEDIDEGVDKSSPVYKEYLSLKKMSIGDLRKMVGQQHRGPVDLKSYDKQGAISDLLRNKFGGKKVDAAMGLSEAYKKGDKVTVGTGSMTVDVKDIAVKESLEEAVRSHPKGYDRLSSSEYSKAKKNKNFSKDDWAWDNKVDLYTRVTNEDLDEAFYKAGSEKSKLDSGYRSHLKDDEGKTAYIGNVSYKKADTAKGEAEVYGDAYYKTAGKSGNERAADKAIVKYRQAHKKDIVESALTFSAMREAQLSPGEYIKTYKKSTGKSVADPVQFRKTKFAILKNKKPLVLKGKEAVVVGQGNAEKAVAELQARDPKGDYKAMRTESLDEAVSPIVKSTAVGRKNLLKVNAEVVKLMALSDDKTMKKYYADILKQLNWADGRLKQLGKPE